MLAVAVVVALVALLGWAAWTLFTSAEAEVTAAVIVASGSILVSAGTLHWSNRQRTRQQIEQEQRKKKAEVYEEFMVYWVAVMRGERRRATKAEREKMDKAYFRTVPPQMMAWASQRVLKEYALHASPLEQDAPDRNILDFEEIIYAIRKDLGYSDDELVRGDLLRTFLIGVDETLEAERRQGA